MKSVLCFSYFMCLIVFAFTGSGGDFLKIIQFAHIIGYLWPGGGARRPYSIPSDHAFTYYSHSWYCCQFSCESEINHIWFCCVLFSYEGLTIEPVGFCWEEFMLIPLFVVYFHYCSSSRKRDQPNSYQI